MIEVFNTFEDVIWFLEGYTNNEYYKAEIFKLEDGRWRVGIITESQTELDV